MSVLLRVAYDGSEFHGYARQSSDDEGRPVRTVQVVLEKALRTLYKQDVETRAASRTDAGVHAEGQLVAFDPPFSIVPRGLLLGLSGILPADVTAVAAWHEDRHVRPRHENGGKHYRYRIRCVRSRDPLDRRQHWHLARRLDLDAMRAAAKHFIGTHDFASFRAADCQSTTTTRTMRSIEIIGGDAELGPGGDEGRIDAVEPDAGRGGAGLVEVHVRGTAFLKNMVRIMVGTLVEVGLGGREPETLDELLRTPDRREAGSTAPPQGLTLVEVVWPKEGR